MAWLSITLELEAAAAEGFSEALMEAGADSVALEPCAAGLRVSALAGEGADARALVAEAARIAAIAPPAFATARVADEDWVRRSQAQFGPVRISGSLWIVPTWCEPPDAGARVLDYGCGSGILAVAAAMLGAAAADAVDIDPLAVRATAENAAANGVRVRALLPEAFAGAPSQGGYDLVLANILAGPLIALEPLLAAQTRAGGRILLSGILESQAKGVADAYARDFAVSVPAVEEGWALVEGVRK